MTILGSLDREMDMNDYSNYSTEQLIELYSAYNQYDDYASYCAAQEIKKELENRKAR